MKIHQELIYYTFKHEADLFAYDNDENLSSILEGELIKQRNLFGFETFEDTIKYKNDHIEVTGDCHRMPFLVFVYLENGDISKIEFDETEE